MPIIEPFSTALKDFRPCSFSPLKHIFFNEHIPAESNIDFIVAWTIAAEEHGEPSAEGYPLHVGWYLNQRRGWGH